MEKDVPQLFSGSKKVHRKSRQTQTGSVMRRHNLPRNAPSSEFNPEVYLLQKQMNTCLFISTYIFYSIRYTKCLNIQVVHFLALNSTLPVRWDFLLFWHVYLLLFFTGFKTSLFKFTTNSLLFCSSVNVRENELLPVLLKEMPHLQISPEALGRMWEQQLQQVDRLHSMSLSQSQNHHKLISQVGFEALPVKTNIYKYAKIPWLDKCLSLVSS